jgi:hypothetical protein
MARIECPPPSGSYIIQEEVDMNVQIPQVDESIYIIKDGLASEQPDNHKIWQL